MKKYIQSIFSFALALTVSASVTAQTEVVIESEDFNATTLPTNWVTFGNDPVDPAASGQVLSPGWEFGVTGYSSGFWEVPASPSADGFAISNDDVEDQDKSLDFLGSPILDLTGYDSLKLTFDLFIDGAFGSTGSLILSNNSALTDAAFLTLPTAGAWNEGVSITVANDEELLAGIPFTFTSDMVFGFLHDDGLEWASGVAIDNFEVVGYLPLCEATGTQVPATAVAAVGGTTTTISTSQNTSGEFSVVTDIVGSTEYVIAHSGGAYATVRTGSASGPILDAGFAPLTITTLSTDDLYIVWTDDEFCGTGGGTATHTSSITGGAAVCAASSGTLEAFSGANACLGDELQAATDVASSVPAGFELAYVVTTDPNLTVVDGPNPTPTYTPTAAGTYTIHAIVFDPADAGTIVGAAANGGAAVAALFEENGGNLCGSLDVTGATFTVLDCPDNNDCEDATPLECGSSVAGTNVNASFDVNGLGETVWYTFQGNGQDVTFSTCGNADFDTWLLLWTGACGGLTNVSGNDDGTGCANNTSEFTYYMHPDTLYSVSVSGYAPGDAGTFTLSATCACPAGLDAGTLTPDATTACLDGNGEATLSATEGTAPGVPEGYGVTYVLTSNPGLIIEDVSTAPEFTVTAGGEYTIHTLVSTGTLDLGVVTLGVTPASDVLDIVTNDDNICAALDVTGTGTITVNAPEAGTLTADANPVCFTGSDVISATEDAAPVVPAGSEVIYVLTEGAGLTIQATNSTPEFTVTAEGDYTIHTLVVPTGTDLSGLTTGVEANNALIQNGGTICGALDVTGAPIVVEDCTGQIDPCLTSENTYSDLSTAGGAPCNDGGGCTPTDPDFTGIGIGVYGSETYTLDNVQAGADYVFDMCSGVEAGAWIPEITIVAPDGTTVDAWNGEEATGSTLTFIDNCSISWTATQSGTYSIVINELGTAAGDAPSQVDCNTTLAVDNGNPTVLCGPNEAICLPCEVGTLTSPLVQDVCPGETFDVALSGNSTPGSYSLFFDNSTTSGLGGTGAPVTITGYTQGDFPLAVDEDINGVLSANQLPVLTGTWEVKVIVVDNAGEDCDSTDAFTVNFLDASDPSCITVGIEEANEASINVYPNPSNGEFVVEINGIEAMAQLNVLDLTGRMVYTESAMLNENFRKELNLNVMSGTYLLQILTEEGMITRKLQVK